MSETYDENINIFYEQHMHEDEEIRYILQGAGHFDIRDTDDRWVRMRVEGGDMVILPAGIYHRFTVDEGNVGNFFEISFHFFCNRLNAHDSMFGKTPLTSTAYPCNPAFPIPTEVGCSLSWYRDGKDGGTNGVPEG